MAEQLTLNQRVLGSSPSAPTIRIKGLAGQWPHGTQSWGHYGAIFAIASDRIAYHNGHKIARIYIVEHGPQAGQWRRSLQRVTSDNQGLAPDLAAALAIVKVRHQTEGEDRP